MKNVEAMTFETPDRGEEAARAGLYGLLATLFYGPPGQDLLDALARDGREGGDSAFEAAWAALAQACAKADPEALRDEYEALFVGVGKPEVMLYGSWYRSGFLMEKPLAELRTDLARLGLERPETIGETEDHIALLCEVMRTLITSDDALHASLETQRGFHDEHLAPWAGRFCDTLENHPRADFYAVVARLAREFFSVERLAFDMA
ncbi:MAG: TorD/DmsD family molecular chaperone [Noviherbaspirillum sp.]